MKLHWLAASIFFSMFAISSATAAQDSVGIDFLKNGNAKFAKGDYDGAIADFDHAITLDQNYTDAFNNRGLAKKHKGDLVGALTDYDHAIALSPSCTDAFNNRGNAKLSKRDYDGAI